MTAKRQSSPKDPENGTSGTSEKKPRQRRVRVKKPEPKTWYVVGTKRDPKVFEGEPVHEHVLSGPFNREIDAVMSVDDLKGGVRTDILIGVAMIGFIILTLLLLSFQK